MPKKVVTERARRMGMFIHMAQKHFALDDEGYRAVLLREGGHSSTTLMTEAELQKVCDYFKGLGCSKPTRKATKSKPKGTSASKAVVGKIRALWLSLWHLGALESGDDEALSAFICRQVDIDNAEWLTVDDSFRVIEALKAMLRRAGVDWDDYKGLAPAIRARRCVIDAQWRRLLELGQIRHPDSVTAEHYGGRVTGKQRGFTHYDPADFDELIAALGRMIRKANQTTDDSPQRTEGKSHEQQTHQHSD